MHDAYNGRMEKTITVAENSDANKMSSSQPKKISPKVQEVVENSRSVK